MTSSRGIASTVSSSVDDRVGVGRGQVDLVEDRDEREVLAHREVHVGQRLGLDPLGRVDDGVAPSHAWRLWLTS